jgi:hypothetical protein
VLTGPNKVDVFEASAEYGSTLAVVIWIDDFSECLAKQNQKCTKWRKIRRYQLSMEQGLFSQDSAASWAAKPKRSPVSRSISDLKKHETDEMSAVAAFFVMMASSVFSGSSSIPNPVAHWLSLRGNQVY